MNEALRKAFLRDNGALRLRVVDEMLVLEHES